MLRSGKTKKSLFFPAAAGLFLLFTASHRIILFQRKIIVLFGSRYSSKKNHSAMHHVFNIASAII